MRTIVLVCTSVVVLASVTLGEFSVSDNNLILLPVRNDATVSFRIWFKAGSQNDPLGKEGLADITSSMLADASTLNNSYEEVLDKLFPLAASYSAITSMEMTVLSGRVHKDNLEEYYPLFIDAILRPAFKQEDLERIKSRSLNYLENTLRYASDEELGKAVLYNEIFAGTRYGHLTSGTIEGVRSITLDDVRKFYADHFIRENVVIGIGGGFPQEIVDRLRNDLKSLPGRSRTPIAKPRVTPGKGFTVTIVEKNAASTAISMGFPISVLRGTKDWYALAVANSWLGEHRNSSSHLYQVIREDRGLNYGDYSYIEHFPQSGNARMPRQNVARRQQIFEIWIRPVPNEARHFALRAALREFKHFVEKGLTQSQFDLTRNFLRKYILHYAPTTMERLGYALDDKFYGINESHLALFRKILDELSLRDVNAAIKKHLQYGNMRIAIVTKDAAALKEALVNEVPSPITYPAEKPERVLREDEEISKFPLNIEAGNVKIVPVADLFSN